MKRKFNLMSIAILLGGSVLFSSCIGSFNLTNKLLTWNKSVGDKFVNELVFLAFCIVPIYEIALLADAVVLNSIEFWTGDNPVAENQVKKVEGEKGNYTVTTKADGYKVEKEGSDEVVEFRFNKEDKVWSVEAAGQSVKLMQMVNNDQVMMYMPDGSTMNVDLSKAGVMAFKQVVENKTYFAVK